MRVSVIFNIEAAFKNIGDEDIEKNLVCVFPSNHMNKFIDHKLMIFEKKKGKYPFIIANTQAYSTLNIINLTFFSLIFSDLMA